MMNLIKNEVIINFPLPEWTDETGKVWGNPTLEFMQKRGWLALPETPKSLDDLFKEAQGNLTNTIQSHLDNVARSCLYDDIKSLSTYASSTDTVFKEEAIAGIAWRDACWRKGYQILNDVLTGTRSIPTEEELLSELPAIPRVLVMTAAARDGISTEEDTTFSTENMTLWQTIKSWFS